MEQVNESFAQPLKTRPPVEQDRIVAWLREEIHQRRLRPGDRLPGRVDLQERFKVSTMTVQRAFDRLVAEGSVEVRGRQGTYIAADPPGLHHFVLALPLGKERRVRLWDVMIEVAPTIFAAPDWLTVRGSIDKGLDSPEYEALCTDAGQHRIAGILFATKPFLVRHTPILEAPGIARVAIAGGSEPGVPCTIRLAGGILARAIDFLQGRQRQRIALITVPQADQAGEFAAEVRRRGLVYDPRLHQCLMNEPGEWPEHLVKLLMSLPAGQRPDALIIRDDNLADAVCAGLRSLQVDPRDLDVVSHCNYPEPPPDYPVTQLGYDIPQLLQVAHASLRAQIAGEEVNAFITLNPVFAWERKSAATQLQTRGSSQP